MTFNHLHCHTQFSLLDGAADISKLYKKAVKDGMRGMAITDHGNMFGVFQFVAEAGKHKNADGSPAIKPIVGCEFYVVEDRGRKQFSKDQKDRRNHQLLLAKNDIGYRNLVKLCSLGYIEGLYSKYPRIDKELILQYKDGLIATTCCIGAEVPQTILKKGEEEGEKVFKWWLEQFGEDYFVEIQRHGMAEQDKVNEVLVRFAKKYNVPIIASNDSHYVDQQDWNAHDILLCLNTGEKQATPKLKEFSDDDVSVKGKRFAFFNDQFYFKTTQEMEKLFSDIPEAIDNTNLIVDRVEHLKLKKDILLPFYEIPKGFTSQDEYLHFITYEGAKQRYGDLLTESVTERLDFELNTIKIMGFAGYFLIVSDFIKAGRDLGVLIGPGRGSAAGSAVAYCIGITNIDPIKYNLLFERFLNPDRKSMPDIDTDFDDEGRQKVIDYVIEKYGRNQVAQIVTYGTMAARSSIKDVARVLDLPLADSNALAKMVPEKPGISLARVMNAPLTGEGSLEEKEQLGADDLEGVKKIRELAQANDLQAEVIKEALILEGSVRNTGVHAAGLIIAPEDLTNIIPVATAKDTGMLVTQFEGNVIEDAGVIKMDFLGLKTLTIIKDALKMIEENHGVKIDIDYIPLDDKKTFELYQRGDTNGTFQFESDGMQKYLKDLKPDKFEDLIAMNALYRPGPLAYIPMFIRRKHGKEPIVYDLPDMEEHLQETYGITVYQEQVMLLSQKLANFSKGDADVLRKAMGKKQKETLDKMKIKFMEGAKTNGHDLTVCEKVWSDWEAFAQYAFNKSHSTCYAFVAYQTAYLKAHYPAEYMASVLSNNSANLEKITFFMEECKKMGIPVKGPDVNESNVIFSVNKKGEIRFSLSAVKGVGEAAMEDMIKERKNGPFATVFDFVERVNLRTVNKKNLEALAQAGALDSFGMERHVYFASEDGGQTNFIEKLIRYGNSLNESSSQSSNSLFGESEAVEINKPSPPKSESWGRLEELRREKEMIGIYLSGHPLDDYKIELQYFCTPNIKLSELANDLKPYKGKDLMIGGIITSVEHRTTKTGKPFGKFKLEDYEGSVEFTLWSEDYLKFRNYLLDNLFVAVKCQVKGKSWGNDPSGENVELKIQTIALLEKLKETQSKVLTLTLPIEMLDESVLNTIVENVLLHKGNNQLRIHFVERESNTRLDTFSRKFKVDLNNQLIKAFSEIPSATWELN
ncbi:MAG: DNA polymerase III subunit alpha [Bacteroidia bacterium]|nr:DNA polymerase III subunit alpha [Bacteroidia bacterium]